jgi:hypothetical protein
LTCLRCYRIRLRGCVQRLYVMPHASRLTMSRSIAT